MPEPTSTRIAACPWCDKPRAACPAWVTHLDYHRQSETTWRRVAVTR